MPMRDLPFAAFMNMPFSIDGFLKANTPGQSAELFAESRSKQHAALLIRGNTVIFLWRLNSGEYQYQPQLILQLPHDLRPEHMTVDTHRFAFVDSNCNLHIWVFEGCVWRKNRVWHSAATCSSLEWNGEELNFKSVLEEERSYLRSWLPLVGYYWYPVQIRPPVRRTTIWHEPQAASQGTSTQ